MNTIVKIVVLGGIQMTLGNIVIYNNNKYILQWEDPRELYINNGSNTIRVSKDACTY